MTFLAPSALLWLAAIPAFLWLWRLASSHRRTTIPSLIPFERLLQRASKRRTTLVTNWLFWLQLAALLGLILALAQPVVRQRRTRVVLALLDTSASMGASGHGASPFERARRALLARIAQKSPTEQFLIMGTSPVEALIAQPTSDAVALTRAVESARVSALGGNLATTARIGRALLGTAPDDTLLFTDEPPPAEPLGAGVRMVSVGEPVPNVGIVGVEARGSLCTPTDSRVVVTVQNFSTKAATVTLIATQGLRRLAELRQPLAAHGRSGLAISLPEGTEGIVELTINAIPDGLAVDNHAWVDLHRRAILPVVLNVQTPAIRQAIGTWLNACQALTWSETAPAGPHVVITDREAVLAAAHAPTLLWLPPAQATPVRSDWAVMTDHAIGSYLEPLQVVAAPLNLAPGMATAGLPVIAGFVDGRKVPIVVADEREGRRVVSMLLDPVGSEESAPVLVAFFNSLRWLMGESSRAMTGEPVIVNGFQAGMVRVRRPDGSIDTVDSESAALRYDRTTLAGVYRFSQRATTVELPVNFLNPLESNVLERPSTWWPMEASGTPASARHAASYPLASTLLLLILILLLLEWWRYSRHGTRPGGRAEDMPTREADRAQAASVLQQAPATTSSVAP